MGMTSSHMASSNGESLEPSDAPRSERGYITTRQAADLLGVNRATVINWARQGRFNAIQYGARGIYRFDRAEIVDFLNKSRLQNSAGGSDSAIGAPAHSRK
jgi:excisionase family DNA binding protein